MIAPKRAPAGQATGEESVSERHKRVRQQYQDSEHRRYADWLGLPMYTQRPAAEDQPLAAAILRVGVDHQRAVPFLTSAYDAYWNGDGSALDRAKVDALLSACGEALLTDDELVAAAADVERTIEEDGIFDAPAYRIDGERFIGRQHLPLIERIAREGAASVIPPVST